MGSNHSIWFDMGVKTIKFIKYYLRFYIIVILFSAQIVLADGASSSKESNEFVRIAYTDSGYAKSLQTSIVHYVVTGGRYEGASVDLISAVHVGDAKYFSQLNAEFTKYDALLYELIAPDELAVPEGKTKGDNAVSALQLFIKSNLNLEFQLDSIDYTKSNFEHADLSPDEFLKSMKNRNESFLQLFLKIMLSSSKRKQLNGNPIANIAFMVAFLNQDRSLLLKRLMAKELAKIDVMVNILSGPKGSTIITERNAAAIKVLRRELEKGKRAFGIYYGAGHMPDINMQLMKKLELKKVEIKWLDAWDLIS